MKLSGSAAQADDPQHFEYWHDAHDAIECFTQYCHDQWQFAPMGGPCGLDNAKVWPVIQTYRRKPQDQRDLLAEVRAFAAGVLSVINKDQK